MGTPGIIGGLVDGSGWSTSAARLAFPAGLALIPALLRPVCNVSVVTNITGNLGAIVAPGLLVGVGTRLANGCTAGQGVCGISRFSIFGAWHGGDGVLSCRGRLCRHRLSPSVGGDLT